jgi:putative ABC transport system ATP-binding protein
MTGGRLIQATKEYGTVVRTLALSPTSLTVARGEFAFLLGPSGSGKTTLLNLLGGLDRPTRGSVEVEGHQLSSLSLDALTLFRRQTVGFVFQFFNLVPTLTALENVRLAAELVGGSSAEARVCLAEVGLAEKADRFPSELSGGEQQRVSIARALAKKPRLLLADEPTGALDHETGGQVMRLLREAAKSGCTVVVVTHDEGLVGASDRVIRLRDGEVVSDTRSRLREEAS